MMRPGSYPAYRAMHWVGCQRDAERTARELAVQSADKRGRRIRTCGSKPGRELFHALFASIDFRYER